MQPPDFDRILEVAEPIDGGNAYAVALAVEASYPLQELLSSLSGSGRWQVVLFNPENVVGPAHALTAVDYAHTALRTGKNIARSLHVEAFLFAAATNEISKALRLFQPDLSGRRAAVVISAERKEGCIECLDDLVARFNPRIEPLGYNGHAAELLAREIGIEAREIEATLAESFARAVEKCILSRMLLALLSR